jgi:hypothetical protein
MPTADLSVVIASGAGGAFLFRCLASLHDQAAAEQVEILVVDRCGPEYRARIAAAFPRVRVLAPEEAGHRVTVPELRRHGVEAAHTAIVAIIEEHCTAPPDWLRTIRTAFGPGDAAISGPMLDSDFPRIRDWVVYFSEYNNFLPPWADGERATLNSANIAYARDLVLAERAVLGDGYWDIVLHPRLAKRGRLRAVNAMGVRHTGPFDYGYYLRQRYLLSRTWGGAHRATAGMAQRVAHVVLTPVMPLLMLWRIATRAARHPRLRGRFLLALPLLVPAMAALAWGECLGYLVGTGRALEEVE